MYLRQSTAATLLLGPFIDSVDASVETGLTISQADVLLWKEGGTTLAQKNDATSCTHRSNGMYTCPVNTTDTNTLGTLEVSVAEAGTLVFTKRYLVLPANVYDALVLGTDLLQTDVSQFGNAAGTFASGRPEVNTTHAAGTAWGSGAITNGAIANGAITNAKFGAGAISASVLADDTITAAKIAANAIDADAIATDAVTEVQSGLAKAADLATVAGYLDTEIAAILAVTNKIDTALVLDGAVYQFTANALELGPSGSSNQLVLLSGTAQAGAVGSITLDPASPATNDRLVNNVIVTTGGTGAYQSRVISGYNGTTKVATVAEDFVIAPDNTTTYIVIPFGTNPATIDSIAEGVWGALRAEHQTAGSFGENVRADIVAISGDTTAADNLELMVDGTGLTLTNVSIPGIENELALIRDKTDDITFTVGGEIDVNVQSINNTAVTGGSGTPWGRT